MKCLITGSNGLIGAHLAEFLLGKGLQVFATIRSSRQNLRGLEEKIHPVWCDITDSSAVTRVMTEVKPDRVFHLAAQSLPARSWDDPETTLRVNVFGTLQVLEAVRKLRLDCTVVTIGSSAEYGTPDETVDRISEEARLAPSSPYGVSKVCSDLLSALYAQAFGMKIIRVRPFFVVGPGWAANACVDFSRRIVEVERGRAQEISVGNLEAVRDLVDVRDAVQALWLLAEKGIPGEVYNLCSGQGHTIAAVLERLILLSGRAIPVVRDPQKYRPLDTPVLVGDCNRLQNLGWQPEIPLEQTLADILSFWRRVAATAA